MCQSWHGCDRVDIDAGMGVGLPEVKGLKHRAHLLVLVVSTLFTTIDSLLEQAHLGLGSPSTNPSGCAI